MAAFNEVKALVGALSGHCEIQGSFTALFVTLMYSRTENSTLVTVSMVSTALGDGRWSTEGESECLAALDCGWAAACTGWRDVAAVAV